MALCWRCREFYAKKGLETYPMDHCHHEEPEEKPTICWCEVKKRNQQKIWDGYEYLVLNFCPECGRKL